MSKLIEDEHDRPLEPLLGYGCSHWRTSSQCAADLYDSGAKLWRKEDLADIEQQLAQPCTAEKFTVRRIDGSIVHIKNPMFGVQRPIWEPYVKFQEYWQLVRSAPDVPPELSNCTYFIDWRNQTDESPSCEALKSQFRKILGGDGNAKKVTKIVCFGLGDMNYKPSDGWRIENENRPEGQQQPETSVVEGPFLQHAMALTVADITRYYAKPGDMGVVGEHGAGGFAELDDESIVFSPFVSAPVKQIIADLARPVAIICLERTGAQVFNELHGLYADPESPRTKQMWKGYEGAKFLAKSESLKLGSSLFQLSIFTRIDG
ncbi:hypothetical protein O1611_g6041 [Lasiodiplodia mahajangana]|uniref:Uncharacterized protein n=1 Tax=Lasiodiplodia mahajangana TaxID=1108764 RepID=A0ACC2JJ93_9PEZI|nr:hypothetical protein O1611_g6041 [Lasiodiplodia mahajangana]